MVKLVRNLRFLFLFVACFGLVLPAYANESIDNEAKILSESLAMHFRTPFPLIKKDTSKASKRYANLKGWEHIFDLLAARGVGPKYLATLFQDKRMPKYKNLYFSVEPRESRAAYQRRNTKAERNNALKFYKKFAKQFEEAEKRFGVDKSVILSVLQIETRCGGYTGKSRVFHRLARLAAAAEPVNIEKNFNKHKRKKKSLRLQQVSERALWLEETFLPHVVASIVVSEEKKVHPLDLRGSSAGAIGLPQFLPGNQLLYGTDGNSDGRVDLFSPEDAILSTANFLSSKGWKEGMTLSEQKKVIWHYNHSDPYVDTVLAMAKRLKPRM